MRHQYGNLARSIEFACTLTRTFGEFPQEVFIRPSQNVGIDIVQAESVSAQHIDEFFEFVVGKDPLPRSGGIKVHGIYHALKFGVFPRNGAYRIGEMFSHIGGMACHNLPAGILWQVEADKLVIFCQQRFNYFFRTIILREPCKFILKYIRESLKKYEWQDVVFVFRRIDRPTDYASSIPEPIF